MRKPNLGRAKEYYQLGQTLLPQADFQYQMITPMQLFKEAAAIEPDWVREFAKNLTRDKRIHLQIPTPAALENALEILERQTPFSQLYSVSTLDDEMVVVRMVRDVYLHSRDIRAIHQIRSAVKDALKHIQCSTTATVKLLDKVARKKDV